MYIEIIILEKKEKCKIDNNFDAKIFGGQRHAGIESGYA